MKDNNGDYIPVEAAIQHTFKVLESKGLEAVSIILAPLTYYEFLGELCNGGLLQDIKSVTYDGVPIIPADYFHRDDKGNVRGMRTEGAVYYEARPIPPKKREENPAA